jgi:YegS/Rv2252/BmrU family lipid kinase
MQVCFTEGPGHAIGLARELLRSGYERIVAVGGDGTLNEVLNGFLEQGLPSCPESSLAFIPVGTGCDFQRSIGIRTLKDAVKVLQKGQPHPMDVGRISFLDHAGTQRIRYFANMVSFGMGGEVARRSRNRFRRLGGNAAFLYATLEVFLTYRAKTVQLTLDRAEPGTAHTITNIAVGNGRYHGGGMHVCPLAQLDDGLLEVTVIDALGLWQLARDLRFLYSRNLYVHPKAHHFRAVELKAHTIERVTIEVDGESLGTLPAEITLLPSAIQLWR